MNSPHDVLIQPRFSETDAMSHISNTVMPVWFEESRRPIFEKLHEGISINDWAFILVHMDVDYIAEVTINAPVNVKASVSKIGTTSFTTYHEAWQNNVLCASGSTVIVHFDYQNKKTASLTDKHREVLQAFYIER